MTTKMSTHGWHCAQGASGSWPQPDSTSPRADAEPSGKACHLLALLLSALGHLSPAYVCLWSPSSCARSVTAGACPSVDGLPCCLHGCSRLGRGECDQCPAARVTGAQQQEPPLTRAFDLLNTQQVHLECVLTEAPAARAGSAEAPSPGPRRPWDSPRLWVPCCLLGAEGFTPSAMLTDSEPEGVPEYPGGMDGPDVMT